MTGCPAKRSRSTGFQTRGHGLGSPCYSFACVAALFHLLLAASAFGQLPSTDLITIYPPFAKAGETVQVSLTGTELEDISALTFSDPRIIGEPVTRPGNEEFKTPAYRETYTYNVTVPADIKPGIYEVRAKGYFGLSTARPFTIVPANSVEAQDSANHATPETAQPLEIGATVTGRIEAKKVDWYALTAKKGQRLLIQVYGERIDSKLNGQLGLYDAQGRELEQNRQHFGRDPFLDFTAPEDGVYNLSLSDILYRGGNEFFYRLTAAETAHVDYVFPPAGEPGKKSKFTVFGRNLPGGKPSGLKVGGKPLNALEVEIEVPATPSVAPEFTAVKPSAAILPGFNWSLGASNAVKVGFATAPVVMEDREATSQTIILPCEIAGRFDQAGDEDVFEFTVQDAGPIWVEAIADRLGSSADPYVIVDKKGADGVFTKVADNDDRASFFSVDNLDATNFDSRDSVLTIAAEAGATYRVTLVNQFASGGAAHLYRLAIRYPRPDFQLMTSTERELADGRNGYAVAPLIRKNGSAAFRIIAPRRDGFEGPITVRAEGLPPGLTCTPLVLTGKTETGFLIVSAAPEAAGWSGPVRIVGEAEIHGAKVSQAARSTTLVWGIVFADAFRVRSRLDLQTVLSVSETETEPVKIKLMEDKVWTVEAGKKLELPIQVANLGPRKGDITLQPKGMPGMLRSPPNVNLPLAAADGKLIIDFTKNGNFQVEPGRYQFSVQGIGLVSYETHPEAVKRLTAEKERLDALATAAAGDAEKLKRLEPLKAEAARLLAAATEKAKAKDIKYSVYTQPVTVEVVAAK